MLRRIRVVTLGVAVAVALAGCYHYRVTVPQPNPATDIESRTVHSLFWGLVQEDTTARNCAPGQSLGALDEVRVTTNLGYAVLTVVTLGIWSPHDVAWRCAKRQEPTGTIGAGPSPRDERERHAAIR